MQLWGRLLTCAPIGNRRRLRGLTTRAQDVILPDNQTDNRHAGGAIATPKIPISSALSRSAISKLLLPLTELAPAKAPALLGASIPPRHEVPRTPDSGNRAAGRDPAPMR